MQPAAMMRFERTITAPSCSGVPGAKMLPRISGVSSEPSDTPVSITSCSPVSRSITTSAPCDWRESRWAGPDDVLDALLLLCADERGTPAGPSQPLQGATDSPGGRR